MTAKTLSLVRIATSTKHAKERQGAPSRVNAVPPNRVPRAAPPEKDGNGSNFAHIIATNLRHFHVLLEHIGPIFRGWGMNVERIWL